MMPIFGIKPDNRSLAFNTFVFETNQRLQKPNWIRNPFIGGLRYHDKVVVGSMNPVIPNFAPYGLIAGVLGTFFWSLWFLVPVAVFVGFTIPWWSSKFYFYMFRAGLRKAGDHQKIEYLSSAKIIEEVLFSGSSGSPAIPAGAKGKESGQMVSGQ